MYIFLFSWNKVLSNIWPIEENQIISQGGKIRDKDRATIKEKFAVYFWLYLNWK